MHPGPAHHCSLIRSPRSLDGIAKHACQILEFIEPVGLRLTRGLRQSFGFEIGNDLRVSMKRRPPFLIGKGLVETEAWAHATDIRISSPISDEPVPACD